jgi:hypothetical protein
MSRSEFGSKDQPRSVKISNCRRTGKKNAHVPLSRAMRAFVVRVVHTGYHRPVMSNVRRETGNTSTSSQSEIGNADVRSLRRTRSPAKSTVGQTDARYGGYVFIQLRKQPDLIRSVDGSCGTYYIWMQHLPTTNCLPVHLSLETSAPISMNDVVLNARLLCCTLYCTL